MGTCPHCGSKAKVGYDTCPSCNKHITWLTKKPKPSWYIWRDLVAVLGLIGGAIWYIFFSGKI